jgi:hypothetical protein
MATTPTTEKFETFEEPKKTIEPIDLAKTAGAYLAGTQTGPKSVIKLCETCGEKPLSRNIGDTAERERFCPISKRNCSFIK